VLLVCFSGGWVIEASGLVPVPVRSSLECVVEREVMSKETFRSEDVPFGIANGKSQNPKIWNLQSAV
jgi:hypothetical protein